MRVFRKAFLLFAVWCFLLTACGSDSKSASVTPSDDPASEEDGGSEDSKDSGKSGNFGSKTPSKDVNVDNKTTDDPVIVSNARDSRTGDSIKTVQIGMYIWMAENVAQRGWSTSSVCYDEDEANCEKYGRLYDSASAALACPSGFFVPTINDWRWLSNYSAKYPETASALQVKYGGYCSQVMDSLVCKGQDDYGKYLTQEGVAVLYPVNMKPSSEKADYHDYYLLRCLNYTYIVESVKDLPTCDSVSKKTLKPFYVVDEKSNYQCLGNRWEDDFTDDCSHVIDRTSAIFKDTMYICKYKEWQVADISDAREKCSAENDSTTLLFNGARYACENGYWREFTEIENKLGYCRGKLIGSFETLKSRKDSVEKTNEYICDTNGWRLSVMTDHVGFCDSLRTFETVKFTGLSYVCRDSSWQMFSSLEQEIGVCSPKKNRVIDSTESGSTYICDSASWNWRYTKLEDFIGMCDSAKIGTVMKHAGKGYLCKERGWDQLSDLENEIGVCYEKLVGTLAQTRTGVDYVCASSGWSKAVAADIAGACDSSKQYKTVNVSGLGYYCTGLSWSRISTLDSTLGFCTEKIRGKIDSVGEGSAAVRYSCESTGWKRMSDLEFRFGFCTSANDSAKKVVHDSVYVCNKSSWKLGTITDMFGICDSVSAGKTGSFMEVMYGCRKKSWVKMSDFEQTNGFCSEKNVGENIKVGSEYYECTVTAASAYWNKTNEFKYVMGECPKKDTLFYKEYKDTLYECSYGKWYKVPISQIYGNCEPGMQKGPVIFNKQEYICDYNNVEPGWHLMTSMDSLRGVCSRSTVDDTVTYGGNRFICGIWGDGFAWKYASYKQYMGTCTSAREGHEMFNGFNTSKCTSGKWVAIVEDYMIDSRNNTEISYKVVKFEGLKWMAQDLNYVTASSDSSWAMNSRSDARLYSFTAAKKACPSGWRLPTETEWNDFIGTLSMHYDYSPSGILAGNWTDLNGYSADDFFGVGIYPTGYVESYLSGGYKTVSQFNTSNAACFWNSDGSHTYITMLASYPKNGGQVVGAAVRCVKD